MKFGIIAAVQEEYEELEQIIEIKSRKQIYELTFIEGKIQNKECVIVKCGVGKVNAARVTQLLIDEYKPQYIIDIGVAGGLNPMLQIGDIVIGESLIQHDFDITAFDHAKGYITNVGEKIYANNILIRKFEQVAQNQNDKTYKVKKGTIATGDIFCTEIAMKEKIYAKFDAQCVEMEGAAIAQVCYLCSIPFVVIRSISDIPNGSNNEDYDQFVEKASKTCAKILKEMIENF